MSSHDYIGVKGQDATVSHIDTVPGMRRNLRLPSFTCGLMYEVGIEE
jgi:hypothetical protein